MTFAVRMLSRVRPNSVLVPIRHHMVFAACMLRVRPSLAIIPALKASYDLRGLYVVKGSSQLDAGSIRASYDLRGPYVVKGSSQPDGACFRIDIIYSTFSPETGTALGPGATGLPISNLFHLPSTSTASKT